MTITHSSTRLVAVALGAIVAVALVAGAFAAPSAQAASLTPAQVSSIISLLQSFGADAATIANVQASLTGGTPPIGGGTSTGGGSGAACYTWTRDLQSGSKGADVMALQKLLNTDSATMVAASGAGSPGNETSTFGPATKAAVIKMQMKYGITPTAGYFGAKSRAKVATMCSGGVVTPGPTPTGPGLTVMASAQPANSLAPEGALRVPFTTFSLTNNSSAAVTVNGVTVQRTGLGNDNNFGGIILLDSNGIQVGTQKTLNSNHQTTIGDVFTIGAGQSMTLTVAGNITDNSNANSGQVVSLQVVGVNTSAPVVGSLPISGASHTINTTLDIGSVSTSTSSFDPGAAQAKNIGDTAVRFTGIRFTANSVEDVKIYSIRWRQVGTASSVDLVNVMTMVNGTSYPTTLSADGKYYTSVFPGGILVAKGNSIDAHIQGDLTGANSASRTIDFDIDRNSDAYFVGQTYGYGVAFSPAYTNTPWHTGFVTTINAGSATTIGKATEVAAQNIAVNVSNQTLGGFVTDFKGESVSVTQMVFRFNLSTQDATDSLLTSVSIVDQNGAIVAGPKDAVDVSGTEMTVTFTDTVTFPTGRKIYTLKGKVDSDVSNGQTITGSTTPSGWSSPTGQTSGNTVTISQGNFSMNAMTVRTAALGVTMSSTPASQTIVAGGQGVLFANVELDAGQSGEDVRLSSIPLRLAVAGGTAVTDLSSCQLHNGSTVLNSGSNVPSTLDGTDTFTFDNSFTVPKGTKITLALKCNVSSGVSAGTFIWSVNSSDTFSSTGVTSGNSITENVTTGNSGTMTVGTAGLVVTLDSSSPSYSVANAGATGVTLGAYRFTASNEPIMVNRVGLQLDAATASSTAADIPAVQLYVDNVLVGSASFSGSSRYATSSLSTPFTVPANSSKVVVVKGTLGAHGASEAGRPGALLEVDVDTDGAAGNNNTSGTGVNSGTVINPTGTTAVAGVRVFKTKPIITYAATSGNLTNGTAPLITVTVNADSAGEEVSIQKLSFTVSTTSAQLASPTFTGPNGSVGTVALNAAGSAITVTFDSSSNTADKTIAAGSSKIYTLGATVSGLTGTTAGVANFALTADTSYPSLSTLMGTVSGLSASNIIWSPNSTTTNSTTNLDWTNGYGLGGCFTTSGLGQNCFAASKAQ